MSESPGISPGTIVGGCQILECIGSGGMGQVYKAQHKRLGRIIALKILPRDVIQRNPAGIERFFQEARALAQVDHPNVLTIHDCGQEGDFHFLQTRFIDGKNLEELIDDHPAGAPWDQTRDILIGALEGLGAVHRAGIVHRDVKPANFMVDPTGKVVLMDFGLAKFLAADNEARTEPGYVLGTPQYMSPEQCDGLELDNRSDIYSLGCVAYFLLTGKRPFDGDNPLVIMKQHRDSFAEPLQALRSDVPAALGRIVERMMNKNPDDRFDTTTACIQALRQVSAVGPQAQTEATGSLPPNYPPTGQQPRGLPPTVGPMTSPGAVALRPPEAFSGPATLEAQSLATAYGATLSSGYSPPAPPRPPSPVADNPYNTLGEPAAPTVGNPYDPMGATLVSPPSVPPPPGLSVLRPGPAAPLPPPKLTPAAPPPDAAQPTTAPAAAAPGPSTIELNANVQKLRRTTGRLDKVTVEPTPAVAPQSAVSAVDIEAAARVEMERDSRVMQAVQCKLCRHIWRLERARVGKSVRCPNCNKDTVANIPENLLRPVNRRRLLLKIVIVVVLVGAFAGTVGYFYRLFEPADQKAKYIAERLTDITRLFEKRDWPKLYSERFTRNLKGQMTEQEWEQRWSLKMNDRRVLSCTLDYPPATSSPIVARMSLEVQRVTGAGEKQTYTARLDLVEQEGIWMIDDFNMD